MDLVKRTGIASVGFQVKSQNDDITERSIRFQHSKAREWNLDGYVLSFARRPTNKVLEAIQVAYHFFENENRRKEMFCALVTPEQAAQVFVRYGVRI